MRCPSLTCPGRCQKRSDTCRKTVLEASQYHESRQILGNRISWKEYPVSTTRIFFASFDLSHLSLERICHWSVIATFDPSAHLCKKILAAGCTVFALEFGKMLYMECSCIECTLYKSMQIGIARTDLPSPQANTLIHRKSTKLSKCQKNSKICVR